MAETYCGKTCSECHYKEELNCPGCKHGPGREIHGDCKLARCCRTTGHEVCDTCSHYSTCGMFRGRTRIPEDRINSLKKEAERNARLDQIAPFCAKYFTILFWLIVPSVIASIMKNGTVLKLLPALRIPGLVLSHGSSIAYGLILLILSRELHDYRQASFFSLVASISNVALLFVPSDAKLLYLRLALALIVSVIDIIAIFKEYKAHSDILLIINGSLANKWDNLRNWNIYALVGTLGGMLIPVVGSLIILVSAIALVVCSVLRLIYLYETSKLFQALAKE